MNKLHYLIKEPKNIQEKNPLLLLIHGYGSNEEDLFSFASELPNNYYIISLRAPMEIAPSGYSWYDIYFDHTGGKFSDDNQAKESRDLIKDFIDNICKKYPIDPTNINLIGFSQGAILSYAVALSYPEKVNKIVALSGYFNPNIILEDIDNKNFEKLSFFVSHGSMDQIIPIEIAQQTPNMLNKYGINCIYKEYPVGHGICPQNFFDFKKFLD